MYSCTFIGHKDCPSSIKLKLLAIIEDLIITKNVKQFYVGTHGNFDHIAYEALCELENKYNIKIFVVLAYLNRTISDFYDSKKTIYPEGLETVPLKFAINKRNMYMIEKSDYMVCFIDNTFSNAYSFVKEALKKNLHVINSGSLILK